jgi:HEAT repeat protein
VPHGWLNVARLVAVGALALGGCGRERAVERGLEAGALAEQARAVEALASSDVVVRRQAAKVLAGPQRLSDSAVLALGGALGDRDRWVREAAAIALRKQGPGAAPALGALIGALDDEDEYVRWRAAEALGRIGAAATPARAALARHAEDPDEVEVVKAASQTALTRIGAGTDGEPPPPGR